MDFITGFILGYFLKEISLYLKRLVNYKTKPQEDWDWLSPIQEDDLP